MKKILFSIFALSALLVSCSKSEVITAPGADSPIEFNPYIGKAAITKATADNVDTLKLKGFQTYAFIHAPNGANYAGDPYMNKVVTYDNDKAKWVYDGNAYWPSTNQLDFIAYGLNAQDANSANITENLTGTAPSITYVVPAVVAQQKDLLVANPQPNQTHGNTSKKVQLTFNHMLSRIAFSLVTKNSNSIPVTITKLQLKGNFYTQGDVDLTAAAPAITQDGQNEVVYDLLPSGSFTHVADGSGVQIYDNSMLYELTGETTDANGVKDYSEAEYVEKTFATDEEEAAAQKIEGYNSLNSYMMIIPTAGETPVAASVEITYFLPGAGYYDITVPLSINGTPIAFEARKAYNFKFKVSTNGISFGVSIDGWDDTSFGSQEFVLS